ncbi:MAG: hypothetical protein LUJ09_03735 [Firmicutes bacterium]|nr:hypothetical protein [Bacillota bacterium]
MQEFEISLHSFQEVQEFMALAAGQGFPVMVGSDAHQANARSLMSMMTLDYREPLRVQADCDAEAFSRFRQQADKFLSTSNTAL